MSTQNTTKNETRTINYGKINDCTVYATKNDFGGLEPLDEMAREFIEPSIIIKYDSGVYPSITNVEQYICDQVALNYNI